jgi:hypothetical protein
MRSALRNDSFTRQSFYSDGDRPTSVNNPVSRQPSRMRSGVASLGPAHFDESITRYAADEGVMSLPVLRPLSRVDVPSRPHTVIASLREDLLPVKTAAASPQRAHEHDGRSALAALFAASGGLPPRPAATSSSRLATDSEFPSLTRVDMLRRRRRRAAQHLEAPPSRRQTPLGMEFMAARIATPDLVQ